MDVSSKDTQIVSDQIKPWTTEFHLKYPNGK